MCPVREPWLAKQQHGPVKQQQGFRLDCEQGCLVAGAVGGTTVDVGGHGGGLGGTENAGLTQLEKRQQVGHGF